MTDAGEKLAERITRKFTENRFRKQNDARKGDLIFFAEEAVRDELERAAGIAEHFAKDELTEEEWPTSGLAEYGQRADAGVIRRCGEMIATAIRKLKE